MKITNFDDRIHIMDDRSDVISVIESIVESGGQEDAFYVCDVGDIVRKHRTWTTLMPRVQPHYAVKCNDSLVVLETLAALGLSFDCASKTEIAKVTSLGVAPSRIIFANPAKMASHIRYAASCDVRVMTFDNATELHKVREFHPDAELVIRLRCDATDAQCPLGMKFGCDVNTDAPHLLRLAHNLGLNVVGVSFHVGSGCREPEVFRRAIAMSRKLFDLASDLGYEFDLLDIGGGYPGDTGKSIAPIAHVINTALDDFFPPSSMGNVRVIAEPGRFYVSSAYTLACNIHSIRDVAETVGDDRQDMQKEVVHRMYYINDGVYGSFNCILYDHQLVSARPLKHRPGVKHMSSSVWGPTCDGLDRVLDDVMLPEMYIGDWLVFENMGAYTLPVASPFNGFPIPKVHIVAEEPIWLMMHDLVGGLHSDLHFCMGGNGDGTVAKMAERRGSQLAELAEAIERLPITIECGGESHVLSLVNMIE